ncbi:MAG: polyphenol oxidase family protein [Muribaculaceae bacterium]|nr:polyphenol oxidase family protein [Muribaculaceae bacterium]
MKLFIPLYEAPGMTAFVVAGHDGEDTLPVSVVTPSQTHSINVRVAKPNLWDYPDTDALISFDTSLLIGVRTADCVPIILHAPDIGAVAAIHAGWRGSLYGIADRTVEQLCVRGADPTLMTAVFGPSICWRCYEVSEQLAADFDRVGFAHCLHTAPNIDPLTHSTPDPSRPHLDLEAVNRTRLLSLGLQPANIIASSLCTRHTITDGGMTMPSYRRDGTEQRLVTCVALTGD